MMRTVIPATLLATALLALPASASASCPSSTPDRLAPGSQRAAGKAALAQAPRFYPRRDLKGARVKRVVRADQDRARGGYARVTCGRTVWHRTYVVYLEFPAALPSASLSQGVVLVSHFRGRYRVWTVLH